MTKYKQFRHIFNIILALAAAFAAIVLFIFLLPVFIYILMTIVFLVIAWQIGSYAFVVVLAAMYRR